MKKIKTIVLLCVSAMLLCGCETYKKQVWTPDGVNYTLSRDRETGDLCDYFGVSWSLK